MKALADEIERYYIPRPRFEDGEPLKNGDKIDYEGETVTVLDYLISSRTWTNMYGMTFQWVTLHLNDGRSVNVLLEDPVKRPTPKVYDADGVEIKVWDTVYSVSNGKSGVVFDVGDFVTEYSHGEVMFEGCDEAYKADLFTHERPVFDAEGVRYVKGQTVWSLAGIEYIVEEVIDTDHIRTRFPDSERAHATFTSHTLTHSEPDSLELIKADRELTICEYNAKYPDAVGIGMDDHLLNRAIVLIERGA